MASTSMHLGLAGLLATFSVLPIDSVLGQMNATSSNQTGNFTSDPFLAYQPHFSRSLPIQLLVTGIVLTLCATLIIQLLFTWQYHWPLSHVNWALQFTGACTLLLNMTATLYVVLTALFEKSTQWPYMFEYIAIDVPRTESWSFAQVTAWCVMEATTSALVTTTHIQFLTHLYPSRLEARLVFFLLGPLTVVSFIMTLLPISTYDYSHASGVNATSTLNVTFSNATLPLLKYSANNLTSIPTILTVTSKLVSNDTSREQQLTDIFDSARGICNLTLSLLFTLSLLIWGFLVSDRHNAWRTDGGTAAFGVGAVGLALVSNSLNFLNVLTHPRVAWITSFLRSVVLWQSFLGWWWWVGSASGIATREYLTERRRRKELKRAKRQRRKVSQADDEALVPLTARLEGWRPSVGVALSRRRPQMSAPISSSQSQTPTLEGEAFELTTISSHTSTDRSLHMSEARSPPSTTSLATSHASRYSSAWRRAWRSLRQAHVRAARVQAIELENGRGLGNFPGGAGHARARGTPRGGGRSGGGAIGEDVRDAEVDAETRNVELYNKPEDGASSALWWWGPVRKWRLRDSTVY